MNLTSPNYQVRKSELGGLGIEKGPERDQLPHFPFLNII